MSRNAKPDCPLILSTLIGLEWLCDGQSDYVELIKSDHVKLLESEYVSSEMRKGVTCGSILPLDISSH